MGSLVSHCSVQTRRVLWVQGCRQNHCSDSLKFEAGCSWANFLVSVPSPRTICTINVRCILSCTPRLFSGPWAMICASPSTPTPVFCFPPRLSTLGTCGSCPSEGRGTLVSFGMGLFDRTHAARVRLLVGVLKRQACCHTGGMLCLPSCALPYHLYSHSIARTVVHTEDEYIVHSCAYKRRWGALGRSVLPPLPPGSEPPTSGFGFCCFIIELLPSSVQSCHLSSPTIKGGGGGGAAVPLHSHPMSCFSIGLGTQCTCGARPGAVPRFRIV